MKILHFLLGSPKQRLTGYFDKIFEEDLIFFGPTTDTSYQFENKTFQVIGINKEISISELFNSLPAGWYPDIVFVETPVVNYIPDFHKCPVTTLCNSRDAWGEMIYNHNIARLFDFVAYQTIDISSYKNPNFIPLFGGANYSKTNTGNHYVPFKKRKTDILAIASYNDGMYHQRYKLFCKISEHLGKRYNIRFVIGLQKDELANYYQNSKIVVDWSNVNSLRAYDAVMNGCLFCSYENNVLISSIWERNAEYVAFSDENLIEKLEYYLTHAEETAEIIRNASEKLAQLPVINGERKMSMFRYCLEQNKSINNRTGELTPAEIAHATATCLTFNYEFNRQSHPENWDSLYFERIEQTLREQGSSKIKNSVLIEAARMAFLLKKEDLFEAYSYRLIEICPDYAWIYLMKAKIANRRNEPENTKYFLELALQAYRKAPELLREYILPFIQKGNTCDARRVTDYMWQSVYLHNNEVQEKAFLYELYLLMAETDSSTGTLDNYTNALQNMLIPETAKKAEKLLLKNKKYSELEMISADVLHENPYDFTSALYNAIANVALGNRKKGLKIVRNFSASIRAFEIKSNRWNKMRLKRNIMSFIIITFALPAKCILVTLNAVTRNFETKL